MQVILTCWFSFKGSRLRVNPNALCLFCLKVFLNHVVRTKCMVVLAPQCFFLCPSVSSLELAPFLYRFGANLPQAPFTPHSYRSGCGGIRYLTHVTPLSNPELFSLRSVSQSLLGSSRVLLRFFEECCREEGGRREAERLGQDPPLA